MGQVTNFATWDRATKARSAPFAVVDLDAYDANAADLVRRAGGRPIRVASKSIRVRYLLERALAREGFAGVMSYALPEALWLVGEGVRDVFVAYPTTDREALQALAADDLGTTRVERRGKGSSSVVVVHRGDLRVVVNLSDEPVTEAGEVVAAWHTVDVREGRDGSGSSVVIPTDSVALLR